MRLDPRKIDKVFVIGLSCLGDMLLSTAALWNLRLFLPHARFCLWVGPRALAAVENDPLWDEIQTFDRNRDFPGLTGRLKFFGEIRKYSPDLVVDLRSGLAPLFSGARYAPLWGLREFMLSDDMHEAERNLVAMASLGVPIRLRRLRFFVSEAERSAAGEKTSFIGEGRPLMVVNPGGGSEGKRWGVDRFRELALYLHDRYGATVGVIGHRQDEKEMAGKVLEALGQKGLDLTDCGSLEGLAAILERASLFVTNDTGPLHLASALGVPTVGIFKKHNLNRFGPWGNPHRTVYPGSAYPPGVAPASNEKDAEGIGSISVDEVIEACDELLGLVCRRDGTAERRRGPA